jgi:hypothetical protein
MADVLEILMVVSRRGMPFVIAVSQERLHNGCFPSQESSQPRRIPVATVSLLENQGRVVCLGGIAAVLNHADLEPELISEGAGFDDGFLSEAGQQIESVFIQSHTITCNISIRL